MRCLVAGLAIAGFAAACDRSPAEAVSLAPPSIRLLSPTLFVAPSAARVGRVRAVVLAGPAQPGGAWPSVRCNEAPLARGNDGLYRGDVPIILDARATTVDCEALSAEGLGARDAHALRVEGARFTVSMTTEPGRWQATRCDDDDLLIVTGDGATRLAPDGRARWAYASDGVALEGLCLLDGGAVVRVISAGEPNVPNGQTAAIVRVGPHGEASVVPRPRGQWPLSLTRVNGAPQVVERTPTGPRISPLDGGDGVALDANDPRLTFSDARETTRDVGLKLDGATFTRPVFAALATRDTAIVLLEGTADAPPAVTTRPLTGFATTGPEVPRPELSRWLDARATDEGVLALGALRRSTSEGALVYLTP